MTLPRILTRPALVRLVGLSVYCERVRQRCLIWHNNAPVLSQSIAPFDVMNGDYLRIAVRPWPRVPSHISTRACVSRIRQQPRRMDYANMCSHSTIDHEDGMTVVDSYIRPDRPLAIIDPAGNDQMALLQRSLVVAAIKENKGNDDHYQCQNHMHTIALRNEMIPPALRDQPGFVHDLYKFAVSHFSSWSSSSTGDLYHRNLARRSPTSSSQWLKLNRGVQLNGAFDRWIYEILSVWDDLVDPFADIDGFVVTLTPEAGQVHVHAHLLLLQHARQQVRSVVVAISDDADDPWHPRLLCLTVPRELSHRILKGYIDLDGACDSVAHLGDRDLTDVPAFEVTNGTHLIFSLRRPSTVWLV